LELVFCEVDPGFFEDLAAAIAHATAQAEYLAPGWVVGPGRIGTVTGAGSAGIGIGPGRLGTVTGAGNEGSVNGPGKPGTVKSIRRQ
jgi:hypothetical protein